MLRKFKIAMSLIVCLALLFSCVPAAPAQSPGSSGEVIAEAAKTLVNLHNNMNDPDDFNAIKNVRVNVNRLSDVQWDNILQPITSKSQKLAAHKQDLKNMTMDLANIFWSETNSQQVLEDQLKDYKNEYTAVAQDIFGTDFDLMDCYTFLLGKDGVTDQIPGVITGNLGDLISSSWKDILETKFQEWVNKAITNAMDAQPDFKAVLQRAGVNRDDLIAVKDNFITAADPNKLVEGAFARAYIRTKAIISFDADHPVQSGSCNFVVGEILPVRLDVFDIPVEAFLNWSSDNNNVAKIERTSLEAVGPGTAQITAYRNNINKEWVARCRIEVTGEVKSIPSSGGELSFEGGKIKVTIPAGLPAGASLAVGIIAQPANLSGGQAKGGQIVGFKFLGVDPAQLPPIPIALKKDPNANPVAIFYYNPNSSSWEYQPSTIDYQGFVHATVSHFSVYGVLQDNQGPVNVKASAGNVTSSSIVLNLSADDPSGIKEYKIYRNNYDQPIITASGSSYTDTGLSASTTYKYKIKAIDNLGNESGFSDELSITTSSAGGGGGGPTPPPAEKPVEDIKNQLESGKTTPEQAAKDLAGHLTGLAPEKITEELKTQVQELVQAIIEKAGTVAISPAQITTTDTSATVTVDAAAIAAALANLNNVSKTLTEALDKAKITGIPVVKQVILTVPPEVAAKPEVVVQIPAQSLTGLSNAGADLVVRPSDALAIVFPVIKAQSAALGILVAGAGSAWLDNLVGSAATPAVQIKTRTLDGQETARLTAGLPATATERMTLAGKIVEVDITAAGGKYTKPVRLLLNYDPAKAKDAGLLGAYAYDEAAGNWRYIDGKVIAANKAVEVAWAGFDQYAVMEYDRSFADAITHWARREIKVMAAKHLVAGVSQENFAPDRQITRAEFAVILARMMNLTADPAGAERFVDVPAGAWYRGMVGAAAKAGLVAGMSENTFAPGELITREQKAAMMARLLKKQKGLMITEAQANQVLASFQDTAAVSAWAKLDVALIAKEEIMKGRAAATFVPDGKSTRAEATVVLYRVLQKI